MRKIVVGFSGGVTSAWCAGWALRTYPREEVVLLWHDTKEEHPDTYRFLQEMAAKLGLPITEQSDGRSVTQVFRDEGYLGNGQNAMCSRILKAEQGTKFVRALQAEGHSVVRVFGYSLEESERIHRMIGYAMRDGFTVRFPVAEKRISKQACADWVSGQGVCPSAMYAWSGHANCVGCVKGGRAYWLAVAANEPEVFEQRAKLEEEFGYPIIRGGGREHITLRQLVLAGLKRSVKVRESIALGPCECGD